jgi:hypothetical protein
MMGKKLAQASGGGGERPPPFTISTITYKVVVYAPDERADTLPLFLLYPYRYSVVLTLAGSLPAVRCYLNEVFSLVKSEFSVL